MKNHFTFSIFFLLATLFNLFFSFGCGDTEGVEDATSSTYNTLLDEPDEQSPRLEAWRKLKDKDWEKLKDKDWEKLKDKDWVRLTAKEVEELMNLVIPQRWAFETEDQALRQKYRHASLFQRFGNIPQVRYIVEFDRMRQGRIRIITLEFAKQLVAYSAATYFLFPNRDNQRSLERDINLLKVIGEGEELRFLDQLRIEDPEAWVKGMRAFLIRRHGSIPEVNTIIEFLRKLELEFPRTDDDCRAYLKAYEVLYDHINTASTYEYYAMLEAVNQIGRFVGDAPLRRLRKYREARAKGISLYDIDWDDP